MQMAVTVDIQLFIENLSTATMGSLSKKLPAEFSIETRGNDSSLVISYRTDDDLENSLDEELNVFLGKLFSVEGLLCEVELLLRVGVFYDIKETIVCPIMLKRNTISMINRFNADIYITGYLCSDPE
ncbi:hypothetical protein [Thiorhodococcus fuscus]|uniref:DUF4279 domain-containing protein n=1 Tax=Thiorhodococcus fuscus TaxID=527200 RepID=A0ABW4YDV9_9GAMM